METIEQLIQSLSKTIQVQEDLIKQLKAEVERLKNPISLNSIAVHPIGSIDTGTHAPYGHQPFLTGDPLPPGSTQWITISDANGIGGGNLPVRSMGTPTRATTSKSA